MSREIEDIKYFVISCKPGFDKVLEGVECSINDYEKIIAALLWQATLPEDSPDKIKMRDIIDSIKKSSGLLEEVFSPNWITDRYKQECINRYISFLDDRESDE